MSHLLDTLLARLLLLWWPVSLSGHQLVEELARLVIMTLVVFTVTSSMVSMLGMSVIMSMLSLLIGIERECVEQRLLNPRNLFSTPSLHIHSCC